MILRFPGTRGEIEESSERHRYHSSIIVEEADTRILIDYGQKHNPHLNREISNFDALLITHAHPDHYMWTVEENTAVEIPVYLTRETLEYGRNKPLNYRIIEPEKKFSIKDISVVAYRVIHSLRCPAVCFRLRGEKTIVYAPDIVDTEIDKSIVFKGVDMLIADGSSLNINMVRRRDGKIFGHTRAKTVINWCKKYGIENLILTHFGKQVVTMDQAELEHKLGQYSENKVRVEVAFDSFKKNI